MRDYYRSQTAATAAFPTTQERAPQEKVARIQHTWSLISDKKDITVDNVQPCCPRLFAQLLFFTRLTSYLGKNLILPRRAKMENLKLSLHAGFLMAVSEMGECFTPVSSGCMADAWQMASEPFGHHALHHTACLNRCDEPDM